jgi:hypothetical protein
MKDFFIYSQMVNQAPGALRSVAHHPPRTIIEVHRLNGDDICEVEAPSTRRSGNSARDVDDR